MENKYYEPEIKEFHVGFEYEIYEDFDFYPEKTWHNQVYGEGGKNHEVMGCIDESQLHKIRVKHLDRLDIEELGFVFIASQNSKMYFKTKDDKITVAIRFNFYIGGFSNVHVYKINLEKVSTLFLGKIKNKSELRRLVQQINIE